MRDVFLMIIYKISMSLSLLLVISIYVIGVVVFVIWLLVLVIYGCVFFLVVNSFIFVGIRCICRGRFCFGVFCWFREMCWWEVVVFFNDSYVCIIDKSFLFRIFVLFVIIWVCIILVVFSFLLLMKNIVIVG